MSTWKLIGWTFALCLPCIAVIEFLSRWRKYEAKVWKDIFDLDERVHVCSNEELEKVWSDVCWFEVDNFKTNAQHLKMLSIMSYAQGRRSQLKHDTNLSKATRSQAAPPPADHFFTD